MVDSPSDPSDFSELIVADRSRIYGYIYAMVHSKPNADDINRQTTLLIWQKFGEFEIGTNFGSWGLQIAHYNIRNFQRSHHRKHLLFFSEPVMEKVAETCGALEDSESDDRLQAMLSCIQQLPDRHQELLKLRYRDGLSVEQIAGREAKTETNTYKILSRLRKSLFNCIKMRLAAE